MPQSSIDRIEALVLPHTPLQTHSSTEFPFVVTMTRVYAAGVVSMVVLMCAMVVAQGLVVPSARSASDPEPPFHFTTHAFEQRLDHFDMYNATTFSQRYLMNDTWFKPGGPIFFYTGNEGPIELFAQNTGFMWDIAPKFGALLLFGEHRYFGHRSVSVCVQLQLLLLSAVPAGIVSLTQTGSLWLI